jgi:hypothetical protein
MKSRLLTLSLAVLFFCSAYAEKPAMAANNQSYEQTALLIVDSLESDSRVVFVRCWSGVDYDSLINGWHFMISCKKKQDGSGREYLYVSGNAVGVANKGEPGSPTAEFEALYGSAYLFDWIARGVDFDRKFIDLQSIKYVGNAEISGSKFFLCIAKINALSIRRHGCDLYINELK